MKKSKWLLLAVLGITLFGAGCQNKSQDTSKSGTSSEKSSKRRSSEKKTSSSEDKSAQSSESSTSSSSSKATADQSSSKASDSSQAPVTTSRLSQLNQQLSRLLVGEKLPQRVPVSAGKVLNISQTGNSRNYTVAYFASAQSVALNDASLAQQTAFATVQKKTYASASAAQQTINYQPTQAGLPTVDLGTGITATQEGAAGSSYTNWIEGRWSLVVRASNINGENGVPLAKKAVQWLHTAMLPVPDVHGAVNLYVSSASTSRMNTVTWSKGSAVYLISASDPMVALQLATSLK